MPCLETERSSGDQLLGSEVRPSAVVILAAGQGLRLRSPRAPSPKPLARLGGLSLAERCVCSFGAVGLRRFVVVLGHEADTVRSHFEKIRARRGVLTEYVVARDWRHGNGASALAARETVGDGPFLLTMVDHVLSESLIEILLASPPGEGEIVLAVDRDTEGVFDLQDVTRVSVRDRRITAIGKELADWQAADTGLFYCTATLFPALEAAQETGDYSLTGGIRQGAGAGRVRAADVSGHPWIDVDTPEALAEAGRRIRASLSKGAEDGWVSQYLNRPLSKRLSLLLARTPATPNQITVAGFLLSLLGSALLAGSAFLGWLAGGILIQAASVIDGCDGEVARLKYHGTARGAWLDTMLDRYADTALALAVTFSAMRLDAAPWVWMTGCLSAVGFIMTSYVTKEHHLRFGQPYPPTWVARLKHRDLRVFLVALGAVVGHPFAGLLVAGLLSHLAVLQILRRGWRIWGET